MIGTPKHRVGVLLLAAGLAPVALAIAPPRPGPVIPTPLLPPPPGAGPPRACAHFDPETTARWAHVRRGWKGGDGAFSVAVSPTVTLWLFGDSIVARPGRPGYAFVRNSAVEERADGTLVTTEATSEGRSTFGFDDPSDQRWFWPGAGFVVGSQLWLFASEMYKSGSGYWGFAYRRSWLLRVALRGRRLTELQRTALPSDGVIWGAAVIHDGEWLYVFGVHDHKTSKHPHVARVPAADPLAPWTFWDGAHWTPSAAQHARWRGSVASEYSVMPTATGVTLVSAGGAFDNGVYAFRAPGVLGPWAQLGSIYKARVSKGTFAYNALLHPRSDGDYELSYNIASLRPRESDQLTPGGLLPRFARVPAWCVQSAAARGGGLTTAVSSPPSREIMLTAVPDFSVTFATP